VQRKFYLFCTYVPSNLLTICNSSFITRTQLRGLFRFLTLQDGLLRVPDRKSPRICILGRWCTRLPKTKWDDTGAPLLEWAVPPNGQTLPGLNGWYQFLNADAILESVCILPRPHKVNGSVLKDKGDINDDGRQMWLHLTGHTAYGAQ